MPIQRTEWEPSPELWKRLKPLARQMRHAPTAAENKLWQRLRHHQLGGVKFRRQYAIERFIVDFCSLQARLIIEVDGPTHEYTQAEDLIRQQYLEEAGFSVIRFSNLDILNSVNDVLASIAHTLEAGQAAHPPIPSA
jgi:very-short-patch-repair endonuclease